MKKYKVEYQRMVGQPHYQYVTELNDVGLMTNIRGWCENFDQIPMVKALKEKQDKFEFDIEATFEHKYWWQNWRKDWIECDLSKYNWCKANNKYVRITLKFIS